MNNLVGGLEHGFYLSIQLGRIIPTDFHIVQRSWNHQPGKNSDVLFYEYPE